MKVRSILEYGDATPKLDFNQFLKFFLEEVIRDVVKRYGEDDIIAAREEFNNIADGMGQDGALEDGYDEWALPDYVEQRMTNGEYCEYDSYDE